MAKNPGTLLTPPSENWEALPACVRNEFGTCIYCGNKTIWDTYEEYTAHFWEFEYEGERGHEPCSKEEFEYNRDSCLS